MSDIENGKSLLEGLNLIALLERLGLPIEQWLNGFSNGASDSTPPQTDREQSS